MEWIGYCKGAVTKSACCDFTRDKDVPIKLPVTKNGVVQLGWQPNGEFIFVVDIDTHDGQTFPEDQLDLLGSKTFVVKTGGDGYHLYFKILKAIGTKKFKDTKFDVLKEVEIKALNQVVIAPGSYFPTEHEHPYVILNDVEPITITRADLKKLLKHYITFSGRKEVQKDPQITSRKASIKYDKDMDVWDKINAELHIPDMVPSPLNGSNRGFCKNGNPSSHTPSLQYYPHTNSWNCFSCHTGGDGISLHAHLKGIKRTEAIRELAAEYGFSTQKLKKTLVVDEGTKLDKYTWITTSDTNQDQGFWVVKADELDSWFKKDKNHKIELRGLIRANLEAGTEIPCKMAEITDGIERLKEDHYMSIDEIYPDPNIIHWKNGIYFFKEDRFVLRSETIPDELVHYNINTFGVFSHDFPEVEATCPLYDKLLVELLEPDQIDNNWDFMAYIPMNHVNYKKAALYIGDHDCGKSTLAEIQRDYQGKNNTCERDFQEICTDRFATASCEGKYLNYDDDVSNVVITKLGRFKKATGHDSIPIQRKGQDSYDAKNITKHLLLCNGKNELPEVKPLADSFTSRIAPFYFLNQFTKGVRGKQEIKDEILGSEEELAGITWKMFQHMKSLYKRKKFLTRSIEEVRKIWLKESDPYYRFILEKCVRKEGELIETETLYKAFMDWAEEECIVFSRYNEIKSVKGFTGRMHKHNIKTNQLMEAGIRDRFYLDIRLKESLETRTQAFDVDKVLGPRPEFTEETIKNTIMDFDGIEDMSDAEIIEKWGIEYDDLEDGRLEQIISIMHTEGMI